MRVLALKPSDSSHFFVGFRAVKMVKNYIAFHWNVSVDFQFYFDIAFYKANLLWFTKYWLYHPVPD